MKRLEDSELIFGRMMRITEPHLIARYNEALSGFGLPETRLSSFRIDMTGFSPEVADEIGDRQYLDPHGVNRRYIILSPVQQELPVVHTAFSNTGKLMHQFFNANRRAINALTIKDVLYGEIDDPILVVNDIEDLLSIEQVEFKVHTGQDLASQALQLRVLIDRLRKDPDAWRDDDMLHEMVRLSQHTGDIRTNTLVPEEVVFRHNTFWSSHFGGVYVFIDANQTTVIGDSTAPGFRRSRPWQVAYIDKSDTENIWRFLVETARVQTPRGSWVEKSGYLDHRVEMLVTMLAFHRASKGNHRPGDKRWVQRWMNDNSSFIKDEGTLPFLLWAKREIESWAEIDIHEVDARGRFILSRANPDHKDVWLVNRLISDQVPFDFVARFVFNKPSFYEDYHDWGEALKEHVVKTVSASYLTNKAAMRRQLFGFEGD